MKQYTGLQDSTPNLFQELHFLGLRTILAGLFYLLLLLGYGTIFSSLNEHSWTLEQRRK